MHYKREKDTAISVAEITGKLCKKIQSKMIGRSTLHKEDKSPVTVADFSAQAIICKFLKERFPSDPIVGEEDSEVLRSPENSETLKKVTSYVSKSLYGSDREASSYEVCNWIDLGNGNCEDRFWTLDPIDGTKGFIRGDQYAIALALIEKGVVKVGVLACPNIAINIDDNNSKTGVIFVAVKGQGAEVRSLNHKFINQIKVSETSSQPEARLVEGVESGHSNHQQQSAIAKSFGITKESIRIDSQAKYGVVARSDADIYLRLPSPKTPDYREKIWDHAAGTLIVEEAGGTVTDIFGAALDFAVGEKLLNNQGVVVSNGKFHDNLIKIINNR